MVYMGYIVLKAFKKNVNIDILNKINLKYKISSEIIYRFNTVYCFNEPHSVLKFIVQ